MGKLKLNAILEMKYHQTLPSKRGSHLPSPAAHTIPDTDKDAIGLLGHWSTLLAPAMDSQGTCQLLRLEHRGNAVSSYISYPSDTNNALPAATEEPASLMPLK